MSFRVQRTFNIHYRAEMKEFCFDNEIEFKETVNHFFGEVTLEVTSKKTNNIVLLDKYLKNLDEEFKNYLKNINDYNPNE